MNAFRLKIVSPDGLIFDGQAQQLTVRTTSGEMGILAGHIPCVAPLGMGRATVVLEGETRYAACIGGMVSVTSQLVTLVATTFEWADNIDTDRAKLSQDRAEAILARKENSDTDVKLAQARLRRALVRQSVASTK